MTATFFNAIFGDAPSDIREVSIFTLPRRKTRRFAAVNEAASYARSKCEEADVYFGMGLIQGSPKGRGKSPDIAAIGALWVDIDIAGGPHGDKSLPPSFEDAVELARSMPMAPSILIDSGHGLHAYWLLSEPWIFESEEERSQAETLTKGWHQLLCDKASARGWTDVENLGDLTRVLRVPGTINHKDEPVDVRIVKLDAKLRYHVCDLEEFVGPALDEKPAPDAAGIHGVTLRPDASPPVDKFKLACAESPRFAAAFRGEVADLTDASRSGQDLSLATIAALRAWSDQEVADLLIAARRQSGANPGKALRLDYITRTIARARKAADERVDDGFDVSEIVGDLDHKKPDSELAPFTPLPTGLFAPPIERYIEMSSSSLNVDRSQIAVPLLGALAGAIGNAMRVEIQPGWSEPVVLWVGLVVRSGAVKSPALDAVMRFTREREAEEITRWREEKVKSDACKLADAPSAAPPDRRLTNNVTAEGCVRLLQQCPRGFILDQDELTAWLCSFDVYKKNKGGADRAFWLHQHGGRSFMADRKTTDPTFALQGGVSVVGTTQPRVLGRCIDSDDRDAGLLSRMLLVAPPELPTRWPGVLDEVVVLKMREMFDRIFDLPMLKGDRGFEPATIPMSDEALDVYRPWYLRVGRWKDVEEDDDVRSLLAKAAGHCARIALVLEVADWAASKRKKRSTFKDAAQESGPVEVGADAVRRACVLMDWLIGESVRLYPSLRMAFDPERMAAAKGSDEELIRWVKSRKNGATVRDLCNSGPRAYRDDRKAAQAALDALAGHGWRWERPRQQGPGRPKLPRLVLDAKKAPSSACPECVDAETPTGTPQSAISESASTACSEINTGSKMAPDTGDAHAA